MAELRQVKQIEAEKQLLLAQSEIYRRMLQVECADVAERLGWVEAASTWVGRLRPVLLLAAPVAGFLVTRRWPLVKRWLFKGLTLWPLLRRIV